jgi:hypothetical protein
MWNSTKKKTPRPMPTLAVVLNLPASLGSWALKLEVGVGVAVKGALDKAGVVSCAGELVIAAVDLPDVSLGVAAGDGGNDVVVVVVCGLNRARSFC